MKRQMWGLLCFFLVCLIILPKNTQAADIAKTLETALQKALFKGIIFGDML